jgi:hypothetical protein
MQTKDEKIMDELFDIVKLYGEFTEKMLAFPVPKELVKPYLNFINS